MQILCAHVSQRTHSGLHNVTDYGLKNKSYSMNYKHWNGFPSAEIHIKDITSINAL